jgi:hypothetical protein
VITTPKGDTIYQVPTAEQIDPSFIFISPTVMKRSDFKVMEHYSEPVEPRVIDSIDYVKINEQAIINAERFVDRKKHRLSSLKTVYDRIFSLMISDRYRAGTLKQTRFGENKEIFREVIEGHLADGTPLQFALPSFPFKLPNVIKSSRRAPDMAELLCLQRLREICHAIILVYPPGAQFVVISDGQIYRRIFGISNHEAIIYSHQAQQMINSMGCVDAIAYSDMTDLVATQQDRFDATRRGLQPMLRQWWRNNPDNLRRLSLTKHFAANVNNSGSVIHDLVQTAMRNLFIDSDAGDDRYALGNIRKVRARLAQRADDAAFEFALLLYTIKELDLVLTCYPRAIRATVHAKPRQWGIHLANRKSGILPWSGVAFDKGVDNWRIRYEFDVQRRGARPVHLKGDQFPFFYEAP